jgi:hypothetical protein
MTRCHGAENGTFIAAARGWGDGVCEFQFNPPPVGEVNCAPGDEAGTEVPGRAAGRPCTQSGINKPQAMTESNQYP